MKYDVEYTDTYGGEANYSWVRRTVVESDGSPVRAAKAAMGLTGVKCDTSDFDDFIQVDPRGSCTRMFITYCDEQTDGTANGSHRISDECPVEHDVVLDAIREHLGQL